MEQVRERRVHGDHGQVTELAYFVVIGLGIGAVYALSGLGIVTLFTGSGLLNFAQGDLMVLGALTAAGVAGSGHGYVAALGAAIAVTGIAGLLLGGLFALPLRQRGFDIDVVVIGTLGVAITMTNLLGIWFGREPERIESPVASATIPIGNFFAPMHYALMLVGAVVVFFGMRLLMRRTDLGLQLRAVAAGVSAARDSGVRIVRMLIVSWLIAAVVGGAAGVLVASVVPVVPESATMLGVNGFSAAILGGLANPFGVLIGGPILGVTESLSGAYLNETVRQAVAPVVLLATLLLRPRGLFASRAKARTV